MRRAVLATLLVALPPLAAAQAGEWEQFQADALHGGTSWDAALQLPLGPWWKQPTGGPIDGSPVVSEGRVFVGSTDGKLYAFDAASGDALWNFSAGSAISGTPAVSGSTVYVVSNGGKLFALDAATGKQRLSAGAGSPDPGASRASPALHEGRLYVATEAGSLLAYDLVTLTQDWSYSPAQEQTGYLVSPATNTTSAVYGCHARGLAASPLRSPPAVGFRKVFLGSDMHYLFAVNESGLDGANRGRTIGAWPANGTEGAACGESVLPATGDVIRAGPAVDADGGLVIVASYDDTVRAYDVDDGSLRWTFTVDRDGLDSRVVATPAVRGGIAYFGSFNGAVYALKTLPSWPYLSQLWNTSLGSPVWSSAALSGSLLVVGADDGALHVLDNATGRELARLPAGGALRSSPAIAGNAVYVGSQDGSLYAFGGARPPRAELSVNAALPAPLLADAPGEALVTVMNLGGLASVATTLDVTVDNSSSRLPLAALAPGAFLSLHVPLYLTAGNHTLRAEADPAHAVPQYDRLRSATALALPVAAPPAPPAPAPAPAPAPPGNASKPGNGTIAPAPVQPAPKAKGFFGVPGPDLAAVAVALGAVASLARVGRRRG